MPLDAICLRALTTELQRELIGCRIDKVQQPTRDQIVLLLRGSKRLLINAGPNQPRLQLTEELRENPAEPPMFCMLLRKHLVGGRIVAIEQPDLERIVLIDIENTNELGQFGKRRLVLEAMGRRSNLLLLDEDGRIVECMRRVEFEVSGARALLPGLFYQFPAPLMRASLLREPENIVLPSAEEETPLDRWLCDHYLGISPLIARELAQECCGRSDIRCCELRDAEPLRGALIALASRLAQGEYTPTLLLRDGKPLDFAYRPIAQYGALAEQRQFPTFSALLDAFYGERERQEIAARRGHELTKSVSTARDRTVRKCAMLKKEYETTQERDTLRLYGELITANFYRIERGARVLEAENYYEENCPTVSVPLDPLLTPQENAAKYFKRYNKAKTAEFHLREQIEKAEREQEYLESVLQEIALAESEQEFIEIRKELQQTGYLRRGKERKELKRSFAPHEYRTASGLRVLVGRSNVQNDELTRKADKRDIWLHTQKIHGSHVILKTDGIEPDEQSLREAAALAAYYSQSREADNVPVDYTPVKFVKKPAGARPGMVVYETYRTVYVTPKAPEKKK